jgi:hypothetical protein
MKKLIALGVIAISMNAGATCTEDFNKGLSEFDFGMTYFNSGASSYQLAVDESRGQGRRSVICSHLLKSTTGFDVAKESFVKCESSFGSAISSCSGQSSDIARENAGVCTGNKDVAANNYQQVALTLKRTCFIQEESSSKIILPEIQSDL